MVGSHLSEDPSLPRLPPPPALPWPAPDTQIPLAGWGRSIQVSPGCSQLTLPGFYPSPSKWPFQATGTLFARASDGPRGELTMPLKGSGGRGRFFPPSLPLSSLLLSLPPFCGHRDGESERRPDGRWGHGADPRMAWPRPVSPVTVPCRKPCRGAGCSSSQDTFLRPQAFGGGAGSGRDCKCHSLRETQVMSVTTLGRGWGKALLARGRMPYRFPLTFGQQLTGKH